MDNTTPYTVSNANRNKWVLRRVLKTASEEAPLRWRGSSFQSLEAAAVKDESLLTLSLVLETLRSS